MLNSIRFILYFISVSLELLRRGGVRAVVAENIALRKQLITLSRHKKRSPMLTTFDRIVFGIIATLINPNRLNRIAISIKPATLLKFHKALVKRKYSLLFSNKSVKKPGPKGPEREIIDAIIEMKRRNMLHGYRRIAMQISLSSGVTIN